MATRNSSGVERRRVRLDGNTPAPHPHLKCYHRMATKPRAAVVSVYDWRPRPARRGEWGSCPSLAVRRWPAAGSRA